MQLEILTPQKNVFSGKTKLEKVKKMILKDKKMMRFLDVFVLCACIAVVVVSCEDDNGECKSCTNSITNVTKEYCGDDLKEAKLLPSMTCK